MSRAVLTGLAKVSGHRRSLERWGPVLREAKRAVAASLGLRRPSTEAREQQFARATAGGEGGGALDSDDDGDGDGDGDGATGGGPLAVRKGSWRASVCAIKAETAGGRWRLRVDSKGSPQTPGVGRRQVCARVGKG